ncbi:MAG: HD domain-containing protein [Candidatus Methylacidiphilales bacterium]|nr:HD domain-containing protein [Candidatus Methylacidiphilales bacterium]
METLTLAELLEELKENPAGAEDAIAVQLAAIRPGRTAAGKPFFDLEVADATHKAKLKIWSDSPAYEFLQRAKEGELCELEGKFYTNDYGLNVNQPGLIRLSESEAEVFLAGPAERRGKLEEDWALFQDTFQNLADARLKAVACLALEQYEKKWKRAAAARSYHHARRGGLLEHTAQMLRCARALAPLYTEVTPDLLYCGVLFHDVGKLWENDYPERGFTTQPTRKGELIGHITIGVEVVNKLWHEAAQKDPETFAATVSPAPDLVRDHLLHLIVSHHGELEFGSPVVPKTPEGWLLHHIDNIDAKIEMLRGAYADQGEVVPGLVEAKRPLGGLLALPLRGPR